MAELSRTTAPILRRWFGVSAAAGRVLEALYESGGEPISRHDLRDFAGDSDCAVSEAIEALRGAMDKGSIEGMMGTYVRITQAGLNECQQALADAHRRGAAA